MTVGKLNESVNCIWGFDKIACVNCNRVINNIIIDNIKIDNRRIDNRRIDKYVIYKYKIMLTLTAF